MKKLLITLLISTSLVIFADDHDEPNYSKFQANYFFNCPNEPACGAAFDKLMKSPEIAKENFEATLMRVSHAGSSGITHSAQFYYKSAARYQRAGEIFSNSQAFAEFGQAMAAAGAQPVYNNLTSYLIAEGDGRKSTAGVTFVANVSNPAVYAPAFAKMAKKMFEEPFGGNSYVLRVEHLGNGSRLRSIQSSTSSSRSRNGAKIPSSSSARRVIPPNISLKYSVSTFVKSLSVRNSVSIDEAVAPVIDH